MLHEAIQSLRPNKGFVMYGDDPKTIIWEDDSVITPTQAQINAAIKTLETQKLNEEKAKQETKNAILAKLGLTVDEVAALLG